jgi:hypothetical protein
MLENILLRKFKTLIGILFYTTRYYTKTQGVSF